MGLHKKAKKTPPPITLRHFLADSPLPHDVTLLLNSPDTPFSDVISGQQPPNMKKRLEFYSDQQQMD